MTLDEELLEAGARRRLQPAVWAVLAGVGVVVVAVLAGWPPGSTVSGEPVARPSSLHPPGGVTGIVVSPDAPAVEQDGRILVFNGGTVMATDLHGVSNATAFVGGLPDDVTLYPDPQHHQVFLVSLPALAISAYTTPSGVTGITADGDGERGTGAAPLDGRLYVTTADTLQWFQFGNNGFEANSVDGRYGTLAAADPSRHRLLMTVQDGNGFGLRAQSPDGSPATGSTPLPYTKGSVVVTGDGQIWAAGFSGSGAVLDRLDPTTLRVELRSPAADRLGPGAIVVGVGQHVLLVRSGSGGDALWCVDAATGAPLREWSSVPGAIALGPDGGYALTQIGSPPQQLTDSNCVG